MSGWRGGEEKGVRKGGLWGEERKERGGDKARDRDVGEVTQDGGGRVFRETEQD